MSKNILSFQRVCKKYSPSGRTVTVLDNLSLDIAAGSSSALIGPSGSGKTTLLGLAAGLDRPSSGSIELDGQSLEQLDEEQLADLRSGTLGFVFQSFQLIPTLTALENVMVPAELRGRKDCIKDAIEGLSRVGLSDRLSHYPAQLSGGEQQRVAIARAFINKPKLLLADEPTGSLDRETGDKVAELLFELHRQEGTTLVIATHNHRLAARTEKVFQFRNSAVEEIDLRGGI